MTLHVLCVIIYVYLFNPPENHGVMLLMLLILLY